MSNVADAEMITSAAELERLEPHWWALWRRSAGATPFQSPAWLINWWRHFAPGALRVTAVWDEGRLVALAPFYLEDGPLGRRLLPIGISLSDYLDVLIDPQSAQGAARALAESTRRGSWDRWELEELRPQADAWLLPTDGVGESDAVSQSPCPVLMLRGAPDLGGCVPARRRRQLRRAIARAGAVGQTAIEPMAAPEEFLDHLFRLHGARWASRGKPGVLDDPTVQAFHRAVLPAMSAAGLARCYTVRLGTHVAGAYYGMLDRGRACAYLGGFDPAFTEESPGSILIGHAIAEAIREGATEFHFLRGAEDYKYSWGATDVWNRKRSLVRELVP